MVAINTRKCVVQSYKELGKLLNLVKNGDDIIGDISSVINRYDEFMDGDATKRISFYLEKTEKFFIVSKVNTPNPTFRN